MNGHSPEGTMEENKPTLFSRLRQLGRHLDQNIVTLKEEFSKPAKSAPQYYDRGLNALKKEIQDLKEEKEAAKKIQGSMENFSNWLESVKELVDKQADDASKIETYLMKFGYIPMEKPSGLFLSSELQNEQSAQDEDSLEKSNGDSESAKVLNVPPAISVPPSSSKKNLKTQEKSAIIASALKSKMGKNGTTMVDYERTPVSSKVCSVNRSAVGLGSSYNELHGGRSLTIEQWLQGVETCEVEVTPDVLRVKRVHQREIQASMENESEKVEASVPTSPIVKRTHKEFLVPETPVGNAPNGDERNKGTPVEPELSEYTTQLLSFRSFATGKEGTPLRSRDAHATVSRHRSIYNSTISSHTTGEVKPQTQTLDKAAIGQTEHRLNPKYCQETYSTPEEPVLSHKVSDNIGNKSPEEPVLSFAVQSLSVNNKNESNTPEEPVLSYHPNLKQIKQAESRTPEEPVLSGLASIKSTVAKVDSATPEEPLLSYQFQEIKSSKAIDKRTPEEPVLSGYAAAMKSLSHPCTETGNSDDMPASPELSDITQSVLSLRNQNFGMSRGNMTKDYSGMWPNKTEDQYSYKNRRTLGSHYEKFTTHSRHERDFDAKILQENVTSYNREPQERKNWPIPGVKVEEFLGVDVNDIPPSPQLSETTQRLFSWK